MPPKEKDEGWFERHTELSFVIKAFALIVFIIWFRGFIVRTMAYLWVFKVTLFLFLPFIIYSYLKYKAMISRRSLFSVIKEHVTVMPFIYSAEKEKKRKDDLPLTTYGLITLNILVFFLVEMNPALDVEAIMENLAFLPKHPNLWNAPLGAFTAMFLHGGQAHLWGNMVFLWVVGTLVERRIGSLRFLWVYITTGLIAGVAFVFVHYVFIGELGRGIGASGAIAGIMGVFAVRCYFKTMIVPVPILGFLPVSLKVRVNSLTLMGVFFLLDLSGGIGQIAGAVAGIAHWAHLGGMTGGMIIAGFLGLAKGAVEERHLDIGVKALDSNMGYGEGGESLKIALKQNPDNFEALLALARMKTKFTAVGGGEGDVYYGQAVRAALKTSPSASAAIFKEYYKKYLKAVDAATMYRLAGILYREKDLEFASRCLEMCVDAKDAAPDVKERALFQHAAMLDEMGHKDAATGYYERFVRDYPNSVAVAKAKARLGR
ncbi:MAG: rhomboid family intramembrane serine protease [Deltaproteobacteria bacterium]|nr:rhomboid family intramembrane serine protease [Deltaproteobacteria bacterium]